MELVDAMKHTGTCRYFKPDPVARDVLVAAVEAARFGPQGGNRQPVRFLVVADEEKKAALREWYLPPWKAYLANIQSGDQRVGAGGDEGAQKMRRTVEAADHFAEHLHEAPAIVVVCAEIENLHPTDADLGRLSVVGGASIYPVMQNFCLALRDQGVASAVTTLLCLSEPQVKELLGIPEGVITTAHVAVGYPARGFPRRLTRMPAEEMVFFDSYGA